MADRPQDNATFTSQTGHDTDGASREYRDNLTVQDESSAAGESYGGDRVGNGGENIDAMGRDRTGDVRTDETHKLISADKVQGTSVYDANGDSVGSIDSIMINKHSGQVAYAVLGAGGFLGIGERYSPLPWASLSYDTALGGYRTSQTADRLKTAPNYSREEVDAYDYENKGSDIDDWYQAEGNAATSGSTVPFGGSGLGDRGLTGSSGVISGNSAGGTMGGTGATGGVGSTGAAIV